MLILLPPSEGKAEPLAGSRLDLASLSFPALDPVRSDVLSALCALCSGPAAKARTTLGITAGQVDELRRNAALLDSPTAPASKVYTGVLYEALDLGSLSARVAKRAATDVAIASALFGLLRTTDKIPAYRLSGDTTLPGVGRLAAAWRDHVSEAILAASGRGIVLDLRSAAYVALGPVPPALAERTAVVRVLLEKNGKRTVVSHHNKATKGRLVRSLLSQPRPRTINDLTDALATAGHTVEVGRPERADRPWNLDVVVA